MSKETPEELKAALANEEAKNAELQKQVVDLQKQVDAKKTKALTDIAALEARVSGLTDDKNTLMDTIKDLKVKLANKTAQAKNATKEVTVERGNKTYVVAIPNMNVRGEIVTAEQLVERTDLVDHLLEIGSESLVEKK